MPTPQQGESKEAFVSRCVPIVLQEGTAKDQKQAVAICYSMYDSKGEMMNGVTIKSQAAEITFFNEINQDFGISSETIATELRRIKSTDPITVRINSIGGSVTEGLAIYNLLKAHKGEVTAIIEGIAASMASIIFLSADKRQMRPNAILNIHNPFLTTTGSASELRKTADSIQKFQDNLLSIYEGALKGMTKEKIQAWMDEDTVFSAREALQYGFATEILEHDLESRQIDVAKIAAKLKERNDQMKFEEWLTTKAKLFGGDASKYTDEQKATLRSAYDAEVKAGRFTTPTDPPANPPNPTNPNPANPPVNPAATNTTVVDIAAQNRLFADNELRMSGIRSLANSLPSDTKLNEEATAAAGCKTTNINTLVAHAIGNNWSQDKFELVMRRANTRMDDISSISIHSRQEQSLENKKVWACALLRNAGVTPKQEIYNDRGRLLKTYGYEQWFDQRTLEEADDPKLRNIGLHQMLDMAHVQAYGHRFPGRCGSDAFIEAVQESLWKIRAAGSTTWTGLNIFDDVANKSLLAAYEAMETTWQEWVFPVNVTDFKTYNLYRLTMTGGYEEVGADGRLKHGGFSDDKYQVSADTFGKIVGLTRKDIINDDLGALNRIMAALGIEGARFLEELFYVHLLNQITTLFPTNDSNNNYISGAGTVMSVDGLTTARQKFKKMTSDSAPILRMGSIMLVTTGDEVVADELYTERNLRVLQTANAKGRPDNNPHVGKYRPICAPYLDNTDILQRIANQGDAIPNQSDTHWLMLSPAQAAQGGIVNGAFLNGNKTPTLQKGDQAFDMLGLLWRAFHDAGAGNGDPKMGVYSKGAA